MNIQKHIGALLLIGAVLVVLPGFKRKSTPIHIPSLSAMEDPDYDQTKQGITLQAKRLSQSETEQTFGKRATRLWRQSRLRKTKRRRRQRTWRKVEQIIPIQISIKNQTKNPVTLGTDDIGLQLTDGNTVTKRLRISPLSAAIGSLITGTVVVASIGIIGGVVALFTSAVTGATAKIGAAVFGYSIMFARITTLVAATKTAVQTTAQNRRVRRTLAKHNFANALQIEPDQVVDTLIFVAENDYKETFDLNVQSGSDENTHAVPFTVTLQERD